MSGRWREVGAHRNSPNPSNNTWNHLVIQVQRTSDNKLTYQSFTLNGQTHVLNWTYSPFSAPGGYGITVDYQMDGNYKQTRIKKIGFLGFAEATTFIGDVTVAPSVGPETVKGKSLDPAGGGTCAGGAGSGLEDGDQVIAIASEGWLG